MGKLHMLSECRNLVNGQKIAAFEGSARLRAMVHELV